VQKFGAEFAYTLDGGGIGELEYENFNACSAKVYIQGLNIHPGYAKNKMMNAIIMAAEFNSLLPVNERPEYTQDYEGFYHVVKIEGAVERLTSSISSAIMIVRSSIRRKYSSQSLRNT